MQKGWWLGGGGACYLREGCGGLARSLLGGRLLGHDLLDDCGTHRLSARAGTIATASLHRQPASTHRSQHIDTDYYSTPAKLLLHRIHQLRGCYVNPASSYTMIHHNRTRKHFSRQVSGNALQVLFFTIRFFSQERLYQLHWSSAWSCKMTKQIFPSFYINMAVVKLHFLSIFLKILRTIPT